MWLPIKVTEFFSTVILLQVLLQRTRSEENGKRLAQLYPDYERERLGCAYDEYDPYQSAAVTSMGHICARLQTTAMQDIYISEGFTKTLGSVASSQEVLDASVAITENMDFVTEERVSKLLKFAKWLRKGAAVMSPVLGILVASFDAVQGVKTPTHHDILGATNRALRRITEEVDIKMAQAKEQMKDMVNMMEKDINKRKYEFLFKHWAECIKLETEEEIALCQRESYRLITASIDDFLLFFDLLDTNTGNFSQTLDDTQRRRIELGMISFRNYAMLSLVSLKAMAMTYDRLRENENKGNKDQNQKIGLCAEMRIRMRKNKNNDAKSKISKKLQYYCFFEEELVMKARIYEMYGNAAVEEIKVVAASRLDLSFSTDHYADDSHSLEQKLYHRSGTGGMSGTDKPLNIDVWERRVTCRAKLQSFKTHECSYEVTLVEKPTKPIQPTTTRYNEDKGDFGKMNMWKALNLLKDKGLYVYPEKYELTGAIQDGDLISGNTVDMSNARSGDLSETSAWCRKRIQKRREEYIKMAHADVERYWANEVMSVVVCGRILAENMTKNCSSDTLRKFLPLADETIIKFQTSQSSGVNANKATDGLLSSMCVSRWLNNSFWKGEFEKPAEISQIYLYIAKSKAPFRYEDATADRITVDYVGVSSRTMGVYRMWNWHFIFHVVHKGWRYMLEVENNGKKISSGYTSASNDVEYWGNPENWSSGKGYGIKIEKFKGFGPVNFKRLKIETASSASPQTWNLCTTQENLELPYLDSPLTFSCDKPTGRVNFVKVMVDEEQPTDFLLAEIRVYGYLEDVKTPNEPTEMAAELKTATQSTTAPTSTAESAIDGSVITIAETKEQEENNPPWIMVEMEEENLVTAVNVQLVGEYKTVTIELSANGEQGGVWKQCGDVGENVNTYNSRSVFRGFERICSDLTSPVKFVRVMATSKSTKGTSVLKVREITVRTPYKNK